MTDQTETTVRIEWRAVAVDFAALDVGEEDVREIGRWTPNRRDAEIEADAHHEMVPPFDDIYLERREVQYTVTREPIALALDEEDKDA